jgi:hypothetical protein
MAADDQPSGRQNAAANRPRGDRGGTRLYIATGTTVRYPSNRPGACPRRPPDLVTATVAYIHHKCAVFRDRERVFSLECRASCVTVFTLCSIYTTALD